MKRFFDGIISIFESLGRARAASALARSGHHKEARALMVGE